MGTPLDAARLFGLFDASAIQNEVSTEEAQSVLVAVLAKDMAYGVPLVPADEAAHLAETFLTSLVGEDVRYFTHGEYGKLRSHPNIGPSWSPATEHTFDSGVLVLNTRQVGCAWFMDED